MDELTEKLSKLDIVSQKRPVLPKRRRSAYGFFMHQQNLDMKSKGQSFPSMALFSKECSKKWKEIAKKDKEKFERKSKDDVSRFEREMAEYEKQKALYDQFVDQVHDKGMIKELAVLQKLKFAIDGKQNVKVNKNNVIKKSVINKNNKKDLNNQKGMASSSAKVGQLNLDTSDSEESFNGNHQIQETSDRKKPQIDHKDEDDVEEEEESQSEDDEDEEDDEMTDEEDSGDESADESVSASSEEEN